MRLQLLQDGKGKATGIFIPITEWRQLKKQYKELAALENNAGLKKQVDEVSNENALNNIKSGLKEVQLYKKGKLKTTSAKDFLSEL